MEPSRLKTKQFWGRTWMLVLRHSTLKKIDFFTPKNVLLNNEEDLFSIIGKIDDTFKYNSKFEFLLEYPETKVFVIWRQSKSPTTQHENGSFAEGFEPIHLIENSVSFGGIQISSNTDYTMFDGDPRKENCFYEIGSYGVYTPGFASYVSGGRRREENLFIRIPSYHPSCYFKRKHSTLTPLILQIITS